MYSEQYYISLCIKKIQSRYELGKGASWKQRDMEFLIEEIRKKSGVVLSLSTVKRLLKNDDQVPQPATLNALVSLIGYDSWQAFKIKNRKKVPLSGRKAGVLFLLIGVSVVSVIGWFLISGFDQNPEPTLQIKGEVGFTADKTVLSGVPNTVIFNYDLSSVRADSFFIQQSWNELEKTVIDPYDKYYTTTYYYPGFHRAKLIANDSILRRKFIHIKTDGWFPLVRYNFEDKQPIYLNKSYRYGERLSISEDELGAVGVDTEKPFITTYFNVRDFRVIQSDNFQLLTRLKMERSKSICPYMRIMIMAEEHIYTIPLVAKGCESDLSLKIGEVIQEGKNNDLSLFGCDVFQWQNLKVKVVNKEATIFLNNNPIRKISFKQNFGKVVGLAISFKGIGSVEYVNLLPLDHSHTTIRTPSP